jgi:hypothetical protein
MNMKRIRLLPALLCWAVLPVSAADLSNIKTLHAEQWEIARADASVQSIEALAAMQREWSQDTGQQIELQYPGGEEGELWVADLVNWLVALGIPSSNLVTVPGSGKADVISIRVIQSGVSFR